MGSCFGLIAISSAKDIMHAEPCKLSVPFRKIGILRNQLFRSVPQNSRHPFRYKIEGGSTAHRYLASPRDDVAISGSITTIEFFKIKIIFLKFAVLFLRIKKFAAFILKIKSLRVHKFETMFPQNDVDTK